MINRDEEVRVIVLPLPRGEWGWVVTPEGEAALDDSLRAEPTIPIPYVGPMSAREAMAEMARERAVAAEAAELARERRNQEIDGDPPALL